MVAGLSALCLCAVSDALILGSISNTSMPPDKTRPDIWPSLLHSMALGPLLGLLAAPLFAVSLFHLMVSRDGLEWYGLITVGLAPVAVMTSAPLARIWLRYQTGAFFGAVASGCLVGIAWGFAANAALTVLLPDQDLSAAFPVSVGLPLGGAHAAVFWISLNYRATPSSQRSNALKLQLLVLVAVSLPLLWLPQFLYFLLSAYRQL